MTDERKQRTWEGKCNLAKARLYLHIQEGQGKVAKDEQWLEINLNGMSIREKIALHFYTRRRNAQIWCLQRLWNGFVLDWTQPRRRRNMRV